MDFFRRWAPQVFSREGVHVNSLQSGHEFRWPAGFRKSECVLFSSDRQPFTAIAVLQLIHFKARLYFGI